MLGKFFKVLLFALCVFLVLDLNKHKSFRDSQTGLFLRDKGLLQHFEFAQTRLRRFCQDIYWWSKQNGPAYIAKTRENIVPILIVVKDFLIHLAVNVWLNVKLLHNYAVTKVPLLIEWVNHYYPGLTDTVYHWVVQIWLLIVACFQMMAQVLLLSVQAVKDIVVYIYTNQVYVTV